MVFWINCTGRYIVTHNFQYESVGKDIGWDFSDVHVHTEGEKWNFYELVADRLNHDHLWLDLASGSGEKIIPHAERCCLLVGSDITNSMIEKANENIRKSGHGNIRFVQFDASVRIDFPDEFFDIITVRHGPFNPGEVARILKQNGVFLTQQVEYRDKENFRDYFGRHQMMESNSLSAAKHARSFKDLEFSDIFLDEYYADEYYEREEDILFLLQHTPIVPDFGQNRPDTDSLKSFVRDNKTEKGIRTNSHRSLLIAKK